MTTKGSGEPSAKLVAAPIVTVAVALSLLLGRSLVLQGLLAGTVLWLLTGTRYKWLVILNRTYRRDLTALVRYVRVRFLLWRFGRPGNATVVQVFQKTAKNKADKVAFHFEGTEWTFRQVDERSNQIANYFKSAGFKRGDTVALFMESRPDFVCHWLGLAKVGVTTALINTNLRLEPLIHSIKVAGSTAIIVGNELASAFQEVQSKLSDLRVFQYADVPCSAPAEPIESNKLLEKAVDLRLAVLSTSSESPDRDIAQGTTGERIFYIYTSGTTGLPKAALINNLRFMFMAGGVHVMLNLVDDDIIYNTLPLYHTAGGMVGIGQAILFGNTVVIRRKFSASNYWKDCVQYKATIGQYIGEMCRYLLATPERPEEKLHKVRLVFGNGLRPAIWTQFVERFHIKEVGEFYGATESNSNLINIDSKPGAVGFVPRYAKAIYPVSLVRCEEASGKPIRGPDGLCIPCAPGQTGVFVGKINPKRAESQFSGYADRAASEEKILRDVFCHGDKAFNSGDILVMDELGYFYFKDRTGDTFRWRGENVSTSEVEAVVSNVAQLSDAVVYGVGIPNVEGRAGMAAIVDTEGSLDLENLAEGVRKSLPAYARPLFLRVMKTLPMTGTYKLQKLDLQREGFDPKKINDALYFLDAANGKFVPLTESLHEDIVSNKIRL